MPLRLSVALACALAFAGRARAQDAGVPDRDPVLVPPGPLEPVPPELPPPELPPEEQGQREGPPILEGIHPHGEPLVPAGEPAREDIPFEHPHDPPGTAGDIGQVQVITLPRTEEPPRSLPVAISAAAGFTVQLGMPQVYYARFEERFEWKIPDFEIVRIGAAVAEMAGDLAYMEAGPTVGMGAYFCEAPWVRCEGIVAVQPGIAAGWFGTYFLFNGSLTARFLFDTHFSAGATAAFSRIGEGNFMHFCALAAFHF